MYKVLVSGALSLGVDCVWNVMAHMCACSISYPAGKFPECLTYCNLWPVCLYHIFRYCLMNANFWEEKLLNIKCGFWFSVQLLYKKILILTIIQRSITIIVQTKFVVYATVILVRVWWSLNCLERFSKNTEILNF
jgi:hypothetical protein